MTDDDQEPGSGLRGKLPDTGREFFIVSQACNELVTAMLLGVIDSGDFWQRERSIRFRGECAVLGLADSARRRLSARSVISMTQRLAASPENSAALKRRRHAELSRLCQHDRPLANAVLLMLHHWEKMEIMGCALSRVQAQLRDGRQSLVDPLFEAQTEETPLARFRNAAELVALRSAAQKRILLAMRQLRDATASWESVPRSP